METAYAGMRRPIPVCHTIRENSTNRSAADINTSTRGLRYALYIKGHAIASSGVLGSVNIQCVYRALEGSDGRAKTHKLLGGALLWCIGPSLSPDTHP